MSTATKPAPFGPDLRAALIAMVRKRVPESEVEDIVQQALAEAIESPHAPPDSESLRRWIFGVAKNKVVDYHRRAGRESFDLPDVEGTPAPHVEADLLRWAERNLPEGSENQKTLDWMLREGEGEKLESIAASEKLPPPRVRQRVSRLRRHFKENWQREVALLAALGVIVSAIVLFVLKKEGPEPITHDIVDPRAEPIRRLALENCAKSEWKPCLEGLDEARRLDPAGDTKPEVSRARQAADSAQRLGDEANTGPARRAQRSHRVDDVAAGHAAGRQHRVQQQ
jgi:DNA-directed RNA polymerase specialized sigma24 family protein